MMLYLIWTERYGFEPVLFTDDASAVRHVRKLTSHTAYQNEPPHIRAIHGADLHDASALV